MTVATLFTQIRYQLSDESKVSYSDSELLTYLNQTNDYVYSTLINHESDLAMKKATLTLTSSEASLPIDFTLDSAVTDSNETVLKAVSPTITPDSTQYSIMSDTIYSDNDTLILFYFYMPDRIVAVTEELTIPRYFENLYMQMIKFLTFNTDEYDTGIEQALMNRFESNILDMTGKRGATATEAVMPFMV